jgi:hypothetical protein
MSALAKDVAAPVKEAAHRPGSDKFLSQEKARGKKEPKQKSRLGG